MTVLERAQRFVVNGGEEEESLLLDCVRDGSLNALSAVQLLAEDMYGGHTFNFEFKAPAAYCLVALRERGLDALVELATRSPTSKNVSLCLKVLACLAAGTTLPTLDMYFKRSTLRDAIAEAARDLELREAARKRLRAYILSIRDEDDAISAVGQELWMGSVSREDSAGGEASELFAALASRRLAISQPILQEYARLLHDSPDHEPTFQLFFESHPQFLDPTAALVWPRPDLAGARSPDFIIRRTDDTYLVVEIETPAKMIVTAANQLSAQATQAVAQAVDYRAFLLERFQTASAHFPRFCEPDCLVIIGLESSLSAPQRAALSRDNRSRSGLRVVGFDWIAERADAVVRNVIETQILVRPVRML